MANRSYLYTYHSGEDPQHRDLAEWNYDIPVAHLLLVGANPTVCTSAIWEVEQKIAIKGDAAQSRPLFLKFLEWLTPQVSSPDFNDAVLESRELIERGDRQGSHYHLELGEIYELEGLELDEMESSTTLNAELAEDLLNEVRQVIGKDGTTMADFEHEQLTGLNDDWESQLGLHFSHILYFHLGD